MHIDYLSRQPDPISFRTIDSLPVQGAALDVIDAPRVADHIDQAIKRGRFAGPTDPIAYLCQKRCLVDDGDTLRPTLAGILCFGRQPQDVLPHAVVDLAHYRGADVFAAEVVHLEKNIGGTIFDQINRVETYLWTHTLHGMTLDQSGLQRIEIHQYPRVVIRELLVNMLAHRDYANTMTVSRTLLFRDRIEWINPGGLPAGLTINDILVAQAARNPVVLSILYEAGYVEAIGQGIDTVVAVLQHEGMDPPHFEDGGSYFRVTVFGKAPEQCHGRTPAERLSDRQRRIFAFMRLRGDVSVDDVIGWLNEKVTVRSIQRDLKALIKAQLVTVVGSGRGRGVRYRARSAAPPDGSRNV
ncbi:MAG: ATP-binding protein [Roseiflexaceae bacterium]|nr:ATP-binding protein [Roseiflexaceae bacterium]MDW8326145.1 ATP-binding protein [Anaerolineales bacterium]